MGQLSIDGMEVGDSYVNMPSYGTVQWQLPAGADWTPERGDMFEVVTRYVVDDVGYPLKHNKQGVATEGIRQIISTTPVVPDKVTLTAIVSRQEQEDAWRAAHAPQAASA